MDVDAARDRGTVTNRAEIRPARALWEYLADKRGLLGWLLCLELLAHSAALAQPMVARWVMVELARGGGLSRPLFLLAGLAAMGIVLSGVCTFLFGRMGQRLVRDLRVGLVRRLLGARVAAIERRAVGDVLSTVGSDTTLLRETVGGALVRVVAAPMTVLAAIVLMGTIDLPMLGLVVVLLGFSTLGEKYALRRVEDATGEQQVHLAAMTSTLQRLLTAFRTVKASGTERREERLVAADADGAYRAGVRAAWAEAVVEMVAVASVDVIFLVVLAVGAVRVAGGSLALGDVVAFLLYVVFLREPVEALSFAATEISEGLAVIRRIEQLRGVPAEQHDPPAEGDGAAGGPACRTRTAPVTAAAAAQRLPQEETDRPRRAQPTVRFDGVWFGYHDRPVLRELTFEVSRGLTVLVGPSGVGKTTVLGLVERFAEVDAGRVLLDGFDVRALDPAELRRRLAYVQQETPLLGTTVREAALYGVPRAELADLDGALRAVALDAWVATLPDGADTRVGERGVAISGGERQRLALARALLRDADVLLLDEATSQLDAVSERTVLDSLAHVARGRIVLAVTHRRSVAAEADQVIVLDGGTVHAVGRHQHLLRSDPLYRELVAGGMSTRELLHNP
jgi:ABC-type multidrug transport system fused ATPase/permease subunit